MNRRVFILVSALSTVPIICQAQRARPSEGGVSDVSGFWFVSVYARHDPRPGRVPRRERLALTQRGDSLSGTWATVTTCQRPRPGLGQDDAASMSNRWISDSVELGFHGSIHRDTIVLERAFIRTQAGKPLSECLPGGFLQSFSGLLTSDHKTIAGEGVDGGSTSSRWTFTRVP